MRTARLHGITCFFAAALGLSCATPSAGETSTPSTSLDQSCGPAPPGHPVKGRRDYRLMALNEKDARDLRYHEHYHIEPARKQLSSGNVKWEVMNNLHFVLHKVPNDHSALALLVQWDKAGGRDKDYASPACYLTWAKQFAPTDPMVWTYGGYYFYQKNDPVLAGQWWEEALVLDPANAEAHYNLGLLMLGQARYPEARQHATAAYAAGYPLPGLRDKLQKVGQWQDPLQANE